MMLVALGGKIKLNLGDSREFPNLLAGDVLFVAGTPVAFPKDDLAKAYEGRMGGVLWAASAATGEKMAEYKLDVPPVWDSIAVAGGRLYLSLEDGRVICMGGK